MTSPGRLIARWAPALLALANGAIVVSLWWRAGGVSEIEDTASALTGLGRLCGLLGAYLVLVQVLLLARIPVLDRTVGFDRLTVWHRWNGKVALSLLIVHAAAITTGYAVGDGVSLPDRDRAAAERLSRRHHRRSPGSSSSSRWSSARS